MIKMMACCDCKIPNILYLSKWKRVRKVKKNMVASTNNVAAPAATKKTESEIDRDRIRGGPNPWGAESVEAEPAGGESVGRIHCFFFWSPAMAYAGAGGLPYVAACSIWQPAHTGRAPYTYDTPMHLHWPGWHPVENCLTRGGRKPNNL